MLYYIIRNTENDILTHCVKLYPIINGLSVNKSGQSRRQCTYFKHFKKTFEDAQVVCVYEPLEEEY